MRPPTRSRCRAVRPGCGARWHANQIVVATPCRLAATDTAMTSAIRAGASETGDEGHTIHMPSNSLLWYSRENSTASRLLMAFRESTGMQCSLLTYRERKHKHTGAEHASKDSSRGGGNQEGLDKLKEQNVEHKGGQGDAERESWRGVASWRRFQRSGGQRKAANQRERMLSSWLLQALDP